MRGEFKLGCRVRRIKQFGNTMEKRHLVKCMFYEYFFIFFFFSLSLGAIDHATCYPDSHSFNKT